MAFSLSCSVFFNVFILYSFCCVFYCTFWTKPFSVDNTNKIELDLVKTYNYVECTVAIYNDQASTKIKKKGKLAVYFDYLVVIIKLKYVF